MKSTWKRFLSLVLCMCMVLALLPNVTMTAFAATDGTVTGLADENIGLSFSGSAEDAWTAAGTQIIGKAQSTSGSGCSGGSDYRSTLTITNKKTTEATLSFDYIQSGNVTINQDAALLPGVETTIAKGAELVVSSGKSIYIYDVDEWGGYCGAGDAQYMSVVVAPGRTGKRAPLADVKVDVNGTLTAIGGIYTTAGGADICSSTGTGVYNQQGTPGTETKTYQYTQKGSVTAHEIPITAAKLHNADGTYTETATANTGDVINYVNGVWGGEEPTELTVTFEANGTVEYPVEGTMTPQTVNAKTDTALNANSFTREGYNFLNWNTAADGTGDSYADGATVNLTVNTTLYAQWEDNHSLTKVINKKDATCTEDGYTGDTVCAICGKENTKGETIQSKGHTEVIDAAKAPTCTETGLTEGKVMVEPTFSWVNPFVDVKNTAYYTSAVEWTLKRMITQGTTDITFSPNGSCTRAHIVTFLWRAAGSPEPESAVSFADVPAGSYYAKAVAWAVENGITLGTTDATFSPNAACTRAQSMTFLYRASEASASGAPSFYDVAADAYYAAAVKWATDNGITNGIGNGLFGSNNTCTRAQIVTFLWRSYMGK